MILWTFWQRAEVYELADFHFFSVVCWDISNTKLDIAYLQLSSNPSKRHYVQTTLSTIPTFITIINQVQITDNNLGSFCKVIK